MAKEKEKAKAELVVKKEPDALSPFGEMERYFDEIDALSPFGEMERYFDEIFRQPFSFFRQPMLPRTQFPSREVIAPSVDIFVEGKEVVIKAEIPGMKKSDINIDISENTMTISGEKKQEKKVEKKDYHRVECSYGSFCRSFRLPENVNSDKAEASFKDGVLEIRMPKSNKEKKKKITIS